MTIKIVCAWCGKPMGTKAGETPHSITHGICKECIQKVQMEINECSQHKKKQSNT